MSIMQACWGSARSEMGGVAASATSREPNRVREVSAAVGVRLQDTLAQRVPTGSYALTVEDDSMTGAGMLQGDQVYVDRSQVAQHGQIVVALMDARLVIARLFRFNGKFELRCERAGCETVRLACDADPFIWGVVVACVRAYAVPASSAAA